MALRQARSACDGLLELVSGVDRPTARTVLRHIAATRLFEIPDVLSPFTSADEGYADEEAPEAGDAGDELGAWRAACSALRADRKV